jgi:predicted metal-dependent peptidase
MNGAARAKAVAPVRSAPNRKRSKRPQSVEVDLKALEQRVLASRVRLALAQPFLATSVMRLPIRPVSADSWCTTAATDGYNIFYNPAWVTQLDDAELRGLLAHEVLHVIFEHSGRRQGRRPRAWNWACDFAINALLVEQGFQLPAGGLYRAEFVSLAAETIYGLLDENEEPEAVWVANGREEQSRSSLNDCDLPEVGDDLLDPDDPRVRPYRGAQDPDREQVSDLCRELRSSAKARLEGKGAKSFETACRAADGAHLDWRAILRDRLTERIKGDWMSYPFSKRHLHRGLFMPSPGMVVPGHIVFAIDTSGSMDASVLEQIAGELRAFRETFPCRTTVIQADARVQSVTAFEAMDGVEIPQQMAFRGRGGTDFRPVFEWVAREAPDALVLYATDGLGSFPEREPVSAVIWLLTDSQAARVPFGAVVRVGSA